MPTNIYDVINGFDNCAKVPALRTIVHSALARAIGAIRQHIRDNTRLQRREEDNAGLDQRNAQDDMKREGPPSEFPERENPLVTAARWHAIYEEARTELEGLTTSKWDAPLSPAAMLEFMASKSRSLDVTTAEALAAAAGIDVATIQKMDELQAQQERESLLEAIPEILYTLEGFDDNSGASIDDLSVIDQHQLGVKVALSLRKAQDQVLNRALRTRSISELGSIPLLKAAFTQARQWVAHFERTHQEDIQEAIDNGKLIKTLDDLPK